MTQNDLNELKKTLKAAFEKYSPNSHVVCVFTDNDDFYDVISNVKTEEVKDFLSQYINGSFLMSRTNE